MANSAKGSDAAITQAECREIAEALLVLANEIERDCQKGESGALPGCVIDQMEQLRALAGKMARAEAIAYAFTPILRELEKAAADEEAGHVGSRVTLLDFSPSDMRVMTTSLDLLRGKLAGDKHAVRIGELVAKAKAATEWWQEAHAFWTNQGSDSDGETRLTCQGDV